MNKKLFIVILGIFLLSIVTVSAEDFNNEIYIDSNSSIKDTIDLAEEGSTIYLKGGQYSTSSNSQIEVSKNLTITSYDGVAIITGDYKKHIFKITPSSKLILKNIVFENVNHLNTQSYAPIINEGKLDVDNCSFKFSSGIRSGAILNNGELNAYNSEFISNHGVYYGGGISNFGNSSIDNCKFRDNIAKEGTALLNSYNMYINNSVFTGNSVKSAEYNSVNSIIFINNSTFDEKSDIAVVKSGIKLTSSSVKFLLANDSAVSASYNFINTYKFKNCQLHIDSNLWCSIESIPDEATDWLVMEFSDVNGNNAISSKTDSSVLVTFRIYDGRSYFSLPDGAVLPYVFLNFNCDNGLFVNDSVLLSNNKAMNFYKNNTKDTKIAVFFDDYYSYITVGTGIDNTHIYVSNDGIDEEGRGTIDKPYKTLNYALDNAINGNTINIMAGSYYGMENSNLVISKQLTFQNYGGEVILYRADSNLFKVKHNGKLTVKGITLTVEKYDHFYPILNNSGISNVINCTIKNADGGDKYIYEDPNHYYYSNQSIIYTISELNLFDSTFVDLENFVIKSPILFNEYYKPFNILIDGCSFINCTAYKWESFYDSFIFEDYHELKTPAKGIYPSFIIHVGAENVSINNCKFLNNDAACMRTNAKNTIVNNTIFDTNKGVLASLGQYAIIDNSIIRKDTGPKIRFVTGHTLSMIKGVKEIRNTQFYENNGFILNTEYSYSDSINLYNCTVINNTNIHSQGYEIVESQGIFKNGGLMNVSYSVFENNYAYYGGVFYNDKFNSADGANVDSELYITNSIFLNNSAELGDDIFVRGGTFYTSDCWWGSNRGPADSIFQDMGEVIINNWAILSFDLGEGQLIASLNKVTDNESNIYNISGILPSRIAKFSSDMVYIYPKEAKMINNQANVSIDYDGSDIQANVIVDNQVLDLIFYNKNTMFQIRNITVYGLGNVYKVILKSVNGYTIFNQTVIFQIVNESQIVRNLSLKTNDKGEINVGINVTMGNYTVKVFYLGDDYFRPSNGTARLEVLPFYTMLNIKESQKFWGNKNFLYTHLYDNFGNAVANQSVEFNLKDSKGNIYKIHAATNLLGQAGIYLDVPEGSYAVNVTYYGDGFHYGSSAAGVFTVTPIDTNLLIEQDTFYGRGNLLTVVLRDDNYRTIFNETITVTFINKATSQEFNITTNTEGRGGIVVNLEPGEYDVVASYEGDELNHASSAASVLKISKVATQLSADSVVIFNNDTHSYDVKLKDIYGRLLAGENILLTVISQNGIRQVFNLTSDNNGIASFKTNIALGNYIVKSHLEESIWYYESEYTSTLIVKGNTDDFNPYDTILMANDVVKYYKNETQYTAILTDVYGNPLSGKIIRITINNVTYSRVTDDSGAVKLSINLNPGKFDIKATYNSTDLYSDSFVDSKITVLSQIVSDDLTKIYQNTRPFIVKFVDKSGNPLSNRSLSFTINNVKYNRITNGSGEAKLNINLGSGTYTIITECDGISKTNTITILNPLATDDLMMFYKDGSRFKATVLDTDGKAMENQTVKFTVNGVDYYRTTNKDGMAFLNINLATGLYSITTEWGNFVNKNDIYVYNMAVNIDVTSQNVKKGTVFEVKLTDGNGNAIVNKEVTFKVNGISYKKWTNETGHAKLNINLNSGLYAIITSFNLYNYQNKISYNTLNVTCDY